MRRLLATVSIVFLISMAMFAPTYAKAVPTNQGSSGSTGSGSGSNGSSFLPACQAPTTDNNGADTGGEANSTPVCSDVNAEDQTGENIFIRLISDVINILSFIVGVSAIIVILVSGIRLITGGGSPETTAGAKRGIIAAIIGIVIVILGQTIVVFVLDKIQ